MAPVPLKLRFMSLMPQRLTESLFMYRAIVSLFTSASIRYNKIGQIDAKISAMAHTGQRAWCVTSLSCLLCWFLIFMRLKWVGTLCYSNITSVDYGNAPLIIACFSPLSATAAWSIIRETCCVYYSCHVSRDFTAFAPYGGPLYLVHHTKQRYLDVPIKNPQGQRPRLKSSQKIERVTVTSNIT